MKKVMITMLALLAMANVHAINYYYAKVTASDGNVSWLKIEWEWNSRYSRYDKFEADWTKRDIKGELDLDEVWTEDGGTGTKRTISEIGSACFFSFSGLTSVKGTSVKKINNQAFQYCSSLTSINFPNLEEIGENAFSYCSSLVSYRIPASVWKIDGRAFEKCPSLTNLTVASDSYNYSVENNILYNKNKTVLCIFLSCRNDTSFVVPSTVRIIDKSAFASSNKLKSVIISNGVETIRNLAFANSNIISVFVPKSVKEILSSAFNYCTKVKVDNPEPIALKNNVFPNTATLYVPIGSKSKYENAQYWNNAKQIVEYAASPVISFTDAKVKEICVNNWDYNGDGELDEEEAKEIKELGTAFKGNTEISAFDELQYFTGLQSIPAYAFYGCTNLSSFKVPSSVTYIGYNAFFNTAWLNSQPDGLLYIGNVLYAYRGVMPQNTKIVVKDGTTCICDYVFSNLLGLTEIELPASLNYIGEYAFAGCRGLSAITIPAGVNEIARYSFNGCGLKSIELPEGLQSIGNSAFRSCTSLESVTIPDKVRTIGKNAFRGCSSLLSVAMPSYLLSVATDAFRDCNQLKRVDISNLSGWCNVDFEDARANPLCFAHHLYLDGKEVVDFETSSDYAFAYYLEYRDIWTLAGTDWQTIKPYVFYGCEGLKTVSITKNITSIGNYAFSGCSSLKAVKTESQPFALNANAFPTKVAVSLYTPQGYYYQYLQADVWNTFKQVKAYPDADVNEDGEVDVVDVIDVVRSVSGTPSDAFCIFLADLDYNKKVTTDDAKRVIQSVINSTSMGENLSEEPSDVANVKVEDVVVMSSKSSYVNIRLENKSENLVGLQMDITLPEGYSLDVAKSSLGSLLSDDSYELAVGKLDGNKYRLTSSSLSLLPIAEGNGDIFRVYISSTQTAVSGKATINNIRLVTSNSERVVLSGTEFNIEIVDLVQGDGTVDNPYLLYDADDFITLSNNVNDGVAFQNAHFKVVADEIDFSGETYTAIGTKDKQFLGHFDGNGVVIRNLSIKEYPSYSGKGLFGYVGVGGSVTGVTMDETCSFYGTYDVGGITGVNKGTVTHCVNKASITAKACRFGGICGDNMGTISDCTNYGDVNLVSNIDAVGMMGGIAGDCDKGIISNCENYGAITALNNSGIWAFGGIVGLLTSGNQSILCTIENCVNKGNVTGKLEVGGIAGGNDYGHIIRNCMVSGCVIQGLDTTAGAICTYDNKNLSNNYYTEDVVVKVGTNTYDGTAPRGVWARSEPKNVTENNGAMLLVPGDVNGNSYVDIGDAVSIVNYLVGKPSTTFIEKAADTNKNTQIDIGDAVTIVNFLVGKTASLSRSMGTTIDEKEPQ